MSPVVSALIAGVICAVLFSLGGFFLRKKIAEAKIGSAEEEAKRILDEAAKEAENSKKDAALINQMQHLFLSSFHLYYRVAKYFLISGTP